MKKLLYYVSAICCFMSLNHSVYAQKQKSLKPFEFVAFGDMPYTLPEDYGRFENLIKETNKQNQVFNVHVGDIKSSKTACSDSMYRIVYNYFQKLEKPLIYTPGDNEWTDCNKNNPNKYDLEERLNSIRKMFYNGSTSLGKTTLPLTSQSLNPKFSTYIENNRWEYSNVSFATIHVVGTNNNFVINDKKNNDEFYNRNEADIAWLNEVFDNATAKNSSCMVIFIHADMYNPETNINDGSGFVGFKEVLRTRVQQFKKPVLLVNGDSHAFLVDKPMIESGKSKKIINNFTRLQVFGENYIHAVKVTIDPMSPNPFRIEQMIIEGN
jgi:hypothetical protein